MRSFESMLRRRGEAGVTYVEMLVAMAVLAILVSAAVPLARWDQKRRAEVRLKTTLRVMRAAIDKYKEYADQGLIILEDVDQMGYPRDLDELVEGVEVGAGDSPDAKKIKFLQRFPVDPMTGEAEWGKRSYQDDWDSDSWGGENVYDVYSLSDRRALDGTYYRDW
ncbi:MAG TPA: type II secretion system protein [Candidatus Polarisedimenticolaceae bacterium]|nr:type II secretion system protein [Candidatus Polarisedimenticolaceae bacterium]